MRRLFILFVAAALVQVAIIGCDVNRNPVGTTGVDPNPIYRVIPNGESVVSATLYLYCASPSLQTVFVHRSTADWADSTVTWSSFGEAFDATSSGQFAANAPGWKSVDITPLVKSWIDSTYDNFGVVLDQEVSTGVRAVFFSDENVMNKPYLEVHYVTDTYDSTQIFAVQADAVINGAGPDATGNSGGLLLTGYSTDVYEYQSLLRFDLPVIPNSPPPDTNIVNDTTGVDDSTIVVDTTVNDTIPLVEGGCTQAARWWAHRAGCEHFSKADSVSAYLPIWIGDEGGEYSIEVSEGCQASKYLQPRRLSDILNPWARLYAELLAAKLNIAHGADDAEIAETIAEVDAYLASHQQTIRRRFMNRHDIMSIHGWARQLHAYNVGEIGPGRCPLDNVPHIYPWQM